MKAIENRFSLLPTADMRAKLAADYERMSAMIFGTPLAFADVMASIEALEHHLNAEPAVGPRVVHDCHKLGHLRPDLVGEDAPLDGRGLGRFLGEGR